MSNNKTCKDVLYNISFNALDYVVSLKFFRDKCADLGHWKALKYIGQQWHWWTVDYEKLGPRVNLARNVHHTNTCRDNLFADIRVNPHNKKLINL